MPDQVLLTPTVWLGASAHHLRFGATLDAPLDSYIDTLSDVAKSLLNDGFRRVMFLNGHGGNIDPMRIAIRKMQPSYINCLLAAGSYWDPVRDQIEERLEGSHKYVGHACEFETSMMLHVQPELVDRDQIVEAGELINDVVDGVFLSRDMRHRTKAGFTGCPDLATAEKGAELFELVLSGLETTVQKLLAETLGVHHQDFTS